MKNLIKEIMSIDISQDTKLSFGRLIIKCKEYIDNNEVDEKDFFN